MQPLIGGPVKYRHDYIPTSVSRVFSLSYITVYGTHHSLRIQIAESLQR